MFVDARAGSNFVSGFEKSCPDAPSSRSHFGDRCAKGLRQIQWTIKDD
jgi:hypothetical protein